MSLRLTISVVLFSQTSIEFVNENIAAKGGVDRWNYIFGIACQLEARLFNTGLQAPTPFQIISDGTYSIQSSEEECTVLAVQNVKALLRPPHDKLLGGYFPSDAGSSVTGVTKTGRNNEKVIEMYCPSFVFELTNHIVACCCNQRWIYIPKLGDWPLSWNCHRIKPKRRPNLGSCCRAILLVD